MQDINLNMLESTFEIISKNLGNTEMTRSVVISAMNYVKARLFDKQKNMPVDLHITNFSKPFSTNPFIISPDTFEQLIKIINESGFAESLKPEKK